MAILLRQPHVPEGAVLVVLFFGITRRLLRCHSWIACCDWPSWWQVHSDHSTAGVRWQFWVGLAWSVGPPGHKFLCQVQGDTPCPGVTFADGAQPKLIETVDVTGKRTTCRRSMGGCQFIWTGLLPHSSDGAVTASCGLGHTCRRSSSRRSSSGAATLKIEGSAIVLNMARSPTSVMATRLAPDRSDSHGSAGRLSICRKLEKTRV